MRQAIFKYYGQNVTEQVSVMLCYSITYCLMEVGTSDVIDGPLLNMETQTHTVKPCSDKVNKLK